MPEQTSSEIFHIEEFKCLKCEIIARTSEQVVIDRQVILASAAVYSVIATIRDMNVDPVVGSLLPLLWWVPFIVVVCGYARWLINRHVIGAIGNYIRLYEGIIDPCHKGWESYVSEHPIKILDLLTYTWIVLIVGTFLLAIIG